MPTPEDLRKLRAELAQECQQLKIKLERLAGGIMMLDRLLQAEAAERPASPGLEVVS